MIFGGMSPEYEVSLKSADSVLSCGLDEYKVEKIGITKDGNWYHFTGENEEILNDSWHKGKNISPVSPCKGGFLIQGAKRYAPDIVLPVAHGDFMEDGRLQAVFEHFKIPYVGSSSYASFIAYNKHLTKAVARGLSIPVAKDFLISREDLKSPDKIKEVAKKIGYPVFVKPSSSGSSMGASIVRCEGELLERVKEALTFSPCVLIEELICGRECEACVLEIEGSPTVIGVGEISYDSPFYDYDTKYNSSGVSYKIPPSLDEGVKNAIFSHSLRLFCQLGCGGLCRFDYFVTESGKYFFNEVNTLPGLTKSSLAPMLCESKGISLKKLVKILCS